MTYLLTVLYIILTGTFPPTGQDLPTVDLTSAHATAQHLTSSKD